MTKGVARTRGLSWHGEHGCDECADTGTGGRDVLLRSVSGSERLRCPSSDTTEAASWMGSSSTVCMRCEIEAAGLSVVGVNAWGGPTSATGVYGGEAVAVGEKPLS